MVLLAKCIKEFELEKRPLSNLLHSAFISSATNNNKIILNTRFIDPARIESLASILSYIVLCPKKYWIDDSLRISISRCLEVLDENT